MSKQINGVLTAEVACKRLAEIEMEVLELKNQLIERLLTLKEEWVPLHEQLQGTPEMSKHCGGFSSQDYSFTDIGPDVNH